ncbi:MAG: exosortase-associated EpsI family protein [Lentisphaerae bacterium]|nr:exosortase-associated EpsI family protein [Lentisphaerota bacterium]
MRASPRHVVWAAALLAAAAAGVILQGRVAPDDRLGVRLTLPDRVGAYTGADVLFCQNPQCSESFVVAAYTGGACTVCGGPLDTMSVGEKRVLPAGTRVVRKRYTRADGPPVTASIVLSGSEHRSIHRPQQCLPAQGYAIEGSRVLDVPRDGRPPLRVMVLELRRRTAGEGGAPPLYAYAYWFAGPGEETPYHLVRLFRTARDRIVHGRAPRWAYVSAGTARRAGSDAYLERLAGFVAALYPYVRAPAP